MIRLEKRKKERKKERLREKKRKEEEKIKNVFNIWWNIFPKAIVVYIINMNWKNAIEKNYVIKCN